MNTCASVHVSSIPGKRILRILREFEDCCEVRPKPKMPAGNPLRSARICLEPKDAAAQIKLILVFGRAALEVWHNPALKVFPMPCGLHDPGFAQNAKMFGGIVLGCLQPFRQFGHRQWTGQQFLNDPPPGLVRQGLEKRCATSRIRLRHTLRDFEIQVGPHLGTGVAALFSGHLVQFSGQRTGAVKR
jgi:hypothetical protein